MATECRRSALRDRLEHMSMLFRDPRAVGVQDAIAMLAHDVGHLEGWPRHRGCNLRERFTVSGLETCSASNGLATACK
jgi:hypothetical protein